MIHEHRSLRKLAVEKIIFKSPSKGIFLYKRPNVSRAGVYHLTGMFKIIYHGYPSSCFIIGCLLRFSDLARAATENAREINICEAEYFMVECGGYVSSSWVLWRLHGTYS